jgi:hypothetical protein
MVSNSIFDLSFYEYLQLHLPFFMLKTQERNNERKTFLPITYLSGKEEKNYEASALQQLNNLFGFSGLWIKKKST